jgi:hypothetical protein
MGLINDTQQSTMAIDFEGVQAGNIHPSDIDACLEINDRVLILFEVKYGRAGIPIGQRLMLERIVGAWRDSKGPAAVIHLSYTDESVTDRVYLRDCKIVKVCCHEWFTPFTSDPLEYLNYLGSVWKEPKLSFDITSDR